MKGPDPVKWWAGNANADFVLVRPFRAGSVQMVSLNGDFVRPLMARSGQMKSRNADIMNSIRPCRAGGGSSGGGGFTGDGQRRSGHRHQHRQRQGQWHNSEGQILNDSGGSNPSISSINGSSNQNGLKSRQPCRTLGLRIQECCLHSKVDWFLNWDQKYGWHSFVPC